jgi:hypothetical protein
MPVFRDAAALEKHLKKALDRLQAETLITVQAELGSTKVSPVDTGRFRSSWFASEGAGTGSVAPEGTDSPSEDAKGLRVDASKTYTLQNALPYAQAIALEGKTNPQKNQKSKPANWFIDFTNVRVPKIQEAAARVVKQEFDL